MSATKFDQNKCRIDLIPPEIIIAIGDVLTFGAAKYGDRNWEKGLPYGRIFAAAMRHLWVWWSGADRDAESGMSHLHHAIVNVMFLLVWQSRKCGIDDRSMVATDTIKDT